MLKIIGFLLDIVANLGKIFVFAFQTFRCLLVSFLAEENRALPIIFSNENFNMYSISGLCKVARRGPIPVFHRRRW